MVTALQLLDKGNLLVAHRGKPLYFCPQQTKGTIRDALLNPNSSGVEFDSGISNDGKLVVYNAQSQMFSFSDAPHPECRQITGLDFNQLEDGVRYTPQDELRWLLSELDKGDLEKFRVELSPYECQLLEKVLSEFKDRKELNPGIDYDKIATPNDVLQYLKNDHLPLVDLKVPKTPKDDGFDTLLEKLIANSVEWIAKNPQIADRVIFNNTTFLDTNTRERASYLTRKIWHEEKALDGKEPTLAWSIHYEKGEPGKPTLYETVDERLLRSLKNDFGISVLFPDVLGASAKGAREYARESGLRIVASPRGSFINSLHMLHVLLQQGKEDEKLRIGAFMTDDLDTATKVKKLVD